MLTPGRLFRIILIPILCSSSIDNGTTSKIWESSSLPLSVLSAGRFLFTAFRSKWRERFINNPAGNEWRDKRRKGGMKEKRRRLNLREEARYASSEHLSPPFEGDGISAQRHSRNFTSILLYSRSVTVRASLSPRRSIMAT